ncbi:MAG: hypothetical protein AAFQ80_17265 [Cyanobacteria bacterium J06621_8]
MPQANTSENLLASAIATVDSLSETLTRETHKILEATAVSTGQTLEWLSSNPILRAADQIIDLD